MKVKIPGNERQYGGAASDGNMTTCRFAVSTNAAGAVVGTNTTAPLAAADVIDIGPLQEGFTLEDAQLVVQAPIGGGSIKLGFVYEDGEDHPTVPQDAAFFGVFAGGTAARVRSVGTKVPVPLPKAARLIATLAGATVANGKAMFIVIGEQTGPL